MPARACSQRLPPRGNRFRRARPTSGRGTHPATLSPGSLAMVTAGRLHEYPMLLRCRVGEYHLSDIPVLRVVVAMPTRWCGIGRSLIHDLILSVIKTVRRIALSGRRTEPRSLLLPGLKAPAAEWARREGVWPGPATASEGWRSSACPCLTPPSSLTAITRTPHLQHQP